MKKKKSHSFFRDRLAASLAEGRLPVKYQVFPVFGHCNSWSMYLPPPAITFGHGMVRVYSEGLLMISHVTSKSGGGKVLFPPHPDHKSGMVGTPNTQEESNRPTSRKLLAVRDNERWPNQEELIEVCTGCQNWLAKPTKYRLLDILYQSSNCSRIPVFSRVF